MAAIDDLNAIVTKLMADVTSIVTELQTVIGKIGGATNDPAIQAAVAQLTTLSNSLETAVTAAQTAVP